MISSNTHIVGFFRKKPLVYFVEGFTEVCEDNINIDIRHDPFICILNGKWLGE